jgi:acyl-CoA synthetase (AMP-forming)/AMP-acid ligase II
MMQKKHASQPMLLKEGYAVTVNVRERDGWFRTGDIAMIDEDGYYRIVDRKKDMIDGGGFKVWPREVEEVLFRRTRENHRPSGAGGAAQLRKG